MREILFRAKRLDNGEWIEGFYINIAKVNPYIATGKLEISGINKNAIVPEMYKVIPETVGQFTGLTDKNDCKIFEGDIVNYQYDNDDCPYKDKDTKKRIGKIFFSEFRASFSIAMGRNCSDVINNDLFKFVRNGNRVEVIGNIHDNPELLVKLV